jgi:uncharacterized protein (DUF58 family)
MSLTIFDESALRKLEQLALVADRVRVGVMKGERRSRKRGTSIEFADYRDYSRGDDLRRLDWNVYARLERPFVKLLEEEEDLAVHLVVDSSSSMDWPAEPELNKLRYALLLAGALGHIALTTGDIVAVTLLGRNGQRWGPSAGGITACGYCSFLTAPRRGETNLNAALQDYGLRGGRPGLSAPAQRHAQPGRLSRRVDALLARGYEVAILHILSPDEVEPPLAGDLKLVDVETGEDAEISLDGLTLAAYAERLRAWQAELAAFSAARAMHYVPVTTDVGWEQLVLRTLRAGRGAQVSMAFLAPLSLLLGLLAIPIILLYMLRLRRREVLVSSTLLWRKLLRDREANAPWQRLRRNLLLILQLLILAALVLALARPFIPVPSVAGGSVVVVLDASASMRATDVGESRFDAARRGGRRVDRRSRRRRPPDADPRRPHPRVLASASADREALHAPWRRRRRKQAAPIGLRPWRWRAAPPRASAMRG